MAADAKKQVHRAISAMAVQHTILGSYKGALERCVSCYYGWLRCSRLPTPTNEEVYVSSKAGLGVKNETVTPNK